TAQHFASISISKNHLQNTLSEAIARRDGKQFSQLRKPLDKQIQKSTIVLFTKPLPPAEVPFCGSTGQRLYRYIHAQKRTCPPILPLPCNPTTFVPGCARCQRE